LLHHPPCQISSQRQSIYKRHITSTHGHERTRPSFTLTYLTVEILHNAFHLQSHRYYRQHLNFCQRLATRHKALGTTAKELLRHQCRWRFIRSCTSNDSEQADHDRASRQSRTYRYSGGYYNRPQRGPGTYTHQLKFEEHK
jgi:hypothetical protein